MTLNYAGRSHDEAMAVRHKQKQKAQEQAGGVMAIEGTEADAGHSCGELSEQGKQVWRTGSGIDGGGKGVMRSCQFGVRHNGAIHFRPYRSPTSKCIE
ncbi:hypothetical protein LMG29542_06912 [Paraburkholderia humisilvae]|uniref:Uncharacterized protein n=1 Tax=Paraburkholderia humisilvae TaxID=627669 RepID=A0A6J5F5J4_9BURK|nr:hypothetical protein LMG29542_06912 [Paraburkholderia humisilvae]